MITDDSNDLLMFDPKDVENPTPYLLGVDPVSNFLFLLIVFVFFLFFFVVFFNQFFSF